MVKMSDDMMLPDPDMVPDMVRGPDEIISVSVETTERLVKEVTRLRSERDELQRLLEESRLGVASINQQNEELRSANNNLAEQFKMVAAQNAAYFASTPKIGKGLLIDKPVFLVDEAGVGFWVDPGDKSLRKAW